MNLVGASADQDTGLERRPGFITPGRLLSHPSSHQAKARDLTARAASATGGTANRLAARMPELRPDTTNTEENE
jgi:hypothetical protein